MLSNTIGLFINVLNWETGLEHGKILKNIVNAAWTGIKAALNLMIQNITRTFIMAPKIFIDAGVNIVKNLWEGISLLGGWLQEQISTLISNSIGGLSWESIKQKGIELWQSFIDGLSGTKEQIAVKLAEIWSSVEQWLSEAPGKIKAKLAEWKAAIEQWRDGDSRKVIPVRRMDQAIRWFPVFLLVRVSC